MGKLKKDKNITPAFVTAAAVEENNKDKETNSSNPSISAVRQAKDWVDNNKL